MTSLECNLEYDLERVTDAGPQESSKQEEKDWCVVVEGVGEVEGGGLEAVPG